MRKGFLWIGGAVVLVLLVLAGRSLVTGPAWSQTLLLPAGETLVLRGATFGTNFVPPFRYSVLQRMPRFFREPLERLFKVPTSSVSRRTSAEPELVLWLEIQPGGTTNLTSSTGLTTALLDDHDVLAGNFVALWFFPTSFSPPRPTGQTLDFSASPRRAKRIGLAVFQPNPDGSRQLLGRLAFDNPAPASVPPWRPEPVPGTKQVENLECTLLGFQNGVGSSTTIRSVANGSPGVEFNLAKPGEENSAVIALAFRELDGGTNRWTVGSLKIADATGNVLPSSSSSWQDLPQGSNVVSFRWSPTLWPSEVWELRVMAKRKEDARFAPGEMAAFNGLVLPATGMTATNFDQQVRLGGVSLRLKEFTRRAPLESDAFSTSQMSQLALTVNGLAADEYVDLVMAVDDQGRILRTISRGSSSGASPGLELTFGFKTLAADARQADFVFAVHRGKEFRFRVDPDSTATNAFLRVQR